MAQAAAPPLEVGRRMPLVLLPEPITLGHAEGGGRRGLALRPGPGGLWLADAGILDAPPQSDWWGPRLSTPGTRTMRRLTFFSLSGGTGRTTLAVEVAGLLAGRMGSPVGAGGRPPRVALLDLDLLNARAGIRLGVPLPVGWNLLDADPADAALARHRVLHRSGIEVFPGPTRPVSRRRAGQTDGSVRVAALLAGLERRGCDVVVLDIPSGLGSVSRRALESADDIFVVLTPTAGGVHDAYRSTAALRELGLGNRLRYVVNRSRGERLLDEAMLDLGGHVVAQIPDDPALERAEGQHRLVGLNGSGRTAEALRALAAAVDPGMAASGGPVHLQRSRRPRWRRAS
jgi:MinD-like ATPase involved in chromosome partitioning or flagellar assembly